MTASALRSICLVAFAALSFGVPPLKANDFDLTPEQEVRMQKFLPRSYAKLSKRNPVHAVSIGDSVMTMYGYGDEYNNTLLSYQTVFLNQLADQFYYPGGVRVIKPGKGQPEKLQNILGLEITLQNMSRGGKLMFHALQPLSTQAFENKPDLVMISYGINDAMMNESVEDYRVALEEVIATVKANGADLLLFGPTLTVEDPPEELIARTRPYANAMREVAEANGIWYSDLGDLSWFVRLDDRSAHLKDAIKAEAKKKLEAAQAQTPPRSSPVVSPMMEQIDPDPEKKAAKLFNQIVEDYRKFFNHGEVQDWVHPDAEFHRLLGRRIFKEVLSGAKPLPWKVGPPSLLMEGDKQCVLSYELENITDTEQTITLLPLIARHWKPQAVPTELVIKPGKKTEVKITWAPRDDMAFQEGMPIADGSICFSVMHASATTVHIDDLNASIQPLDLAWESSSTLFNQENAVELVGRLANTSKEAIQGTWEASLLGQKWNGDFNIAPGAAAPVKINFKLPANGANRQLGGLRFTATSGSLAYRFDRRVELSQNFGLKQELPLVPLASFEFDKPLPLDPPDAGKAGVRFRADADNNALYLSWDVFGLNMIDPANKQPAYVVDCNMDARTYGKRLLPGSTDVVRASGAAADGPGKVGFLQPWVFGSGYGMFYDSKNVQAKLSSRPDGSRRITIALPRAYLYLHEWKVGNGNSQLGFNAYLSIWQKNDTLPAGGEYVAYCLTHSRLHRDEVDALNVLELTDKPTKRWTLRFF